MRVYGSFAVLRMTRSGPVLGTATYSHSMVAGGLELTS